MSARAVAVGPLRLGQLETVSHALEKVSHAREVVWHAPELVIARHALMGYLRSGWVWAEAAAVLVIYNIFFDYPGSVADIPYLCGFAARVLGALSAIGAAVLVRRGRRANAYLSLARLTSRTPYVRGLLLATFSLRLPLFLELFLLYIPTHHSFAPGVNWLGQLIAGTLGLLAICLLIAALIFVLLPPIGSRGVQIVFLVWLVAALSSYAGGGPIAAALTFARAPLLPVVSCLALSTTGIVNLAGVVVILAVVAGYAVELLVLAEWLFSRRDLLLH